MTSKLFNSFQITALSWTTVQKYCIHQQKFNWDSTFPGSCSLIIWLLQTCDKGAMWYGWTEQQDNIYTNQLPGGKSIAHHKNGKKHFTEIIRSCYLITCGSWQTLGTEKCLGLTTHHQEDKSHRRTRSKSVSQNFELLKYWKLLFMVGANCCCFSVLFIAMS